MELLTTYPILSSPFLSFPKLNVQKIGFWVLGSGQVIALKSLARIFHELASRDRVDGHATGQSQGLGPEAYLTVRRRAWPEDAGKDADIRGRSRPFMKYPG